MKILVINVAGFIDFHLAQHFIEKGDDFVGWKPLSYVFDGIKKL
jgi:nucleoside-diphosphate-sugar epimerase